LDLDAFSGYKKAVGIKESLKAVKNDTAAGVFIAKDADAVIVADIIALCREKNIPLIEAESMAYLGKACRIEVGAAVAVRLRES
jgi:large subunit ribosomal protein L7A